MIPKNYVYMNGYCRSKSLPIETIKKILIHLGYIGENDVILPPGRMAGLTYHIDKYKNQKIIYPVDFLNKVIDENRDMIHQIELESVLESRKKRMTCLKEFEEKIPRHLSETSSAFHTFSDYAVVTASFTGKKNDITGQIFSSLMEATILDHQANVIFDGLIKPLIALNKHSMETTGITEEDYNDDVYTGYNIVDFAYKLNETLDHSNVITLSPYSNNIDNSSFMNKVMSHLRMYRDFSYKNNDIVMYQKADQLMNSLKQKKNKVYDMVPLIKYLWYMQYPTLNRLCKILDVDIPEVSITRFDAYALLQCIAKITELLESNQNVPEMTTHRINSANKLKIAEAVNNGKYNIETSCRNIGDKAVYDLLVALTRDGRIQVDKILPVDHERQYLQALLSMDYINFNNFDEFIDNKFPELSTAEKTNYRLTFDDPRCRVIIAKKFLI